MSPAEELQIKRQEREAEFDAMVRAYLIDNGSNMYGDNRRFRFGGALNLISTVRKAFEDRYELTGCADYEKVASELAKVEAMADLCYDEEMAA